MKKFGIFLLGFICGVAFIFIIGALANNNSGLVLFEKEGKTNAYHISTKGNLCQQIRI